MTRHTRHFFKRDAAHRQGAVVLAKEFGYQVSPRSAEATTQEVRSMVDGTLTYAKRRENNRALAAVPTMLIWIFLLVLASQYFPDIAIPSALLLPLFLLVVAGPPLAFGYSRIKRTDREVRELRELAAGVKASPWQAWPCRVEATSETDTKRLMLLAPDGSTAAELHSRLPPEVWAGMTDGRGLVWFAGDLRFGGIVALPSGSPAWWARTVPDPPKSFASTGAARLLEEELTRQAIGFVFDRWR